MKKRLIWLFLAGALVGFGAFELQRAVSNRSESKPEVPETALLLEVSMTRTTSSADDSFWFTAGRPQWDTEADGHFLNCEYRAEDGDFAERRDAPLTDMQWAELEALVRALDLTPYEAPDENLLDASNSDVTITWTDGGEKIKCRYAAEGADALDAFLRELTAGTQTPAEFDGIE